MLPFITLTVTPAAFCASLELVVESQRPSMSVMRFGDRPAAKERTIGWHSIKSFTTTGFVAGTCKMATCSHNIVSFPIGDQIFSKTINLFESSKEKKVMLTSTFDSCNTITVTHNFYGSINASKLTDALWSYFGRLGFVESLDESHNIYNYAGESLHSTSVDLSSIIATGTISAAPGTAPTLYGICISHDRETNNVHYILTDGVTKLIQKMAPQPEVTATDDVKRNVDFGNGISLIASIYGENTYLSEDRALEYEIFEVLGSS